MSIDKKTLLPFKGKEVHFPKNRIVAESRLVGIKKMLRQKQFTMHYKGFMEELLKRYARESTKPSNDGLVWYLPHNGIYHPSTPNKINVVLDCSAEYKGRWLNKDLLKGPDLALDCSAEYKGRWLNKELLKGPDLANQLIGVLLRFRKQTIGFMAHIKKNVFSNKCGRETPIFLETFMVEGSWFLKRANQPQHVSVEIMWPDVFVFEYYFQ